MNRLHSRWCSSFAIVGIMLGVVACAPAAAANGSGQTSSPVPVWARWEASFTAGAAATPETNLTVHFTAPGGREQVVDGFWDGGRTWRVRFMPDEVGEWRYRTVAEPMVEGIHGQQGSFRAVAATGEANPFLRHGRIRVSDNGRYFVHADGTPFFWLGDTAWNGVLLASAEEWETFLADRAAKRFSGIQFVTTQWRAAEGDEHGRLAYTGFDTIRIDPEFFQRMDERIDAINRHGMLAAPVLLWALGAREGNPGFLPESQAIRLARYMVARYGAHHVIWFLGGDGDYSGDQVERWQRIGRAVFDRPGHAPVTLHGRGMQWPFQPYVNEPWFTFIGYQSGHGDDARTLQWIHSGPPAERWRDEPAMPIINLEPPYEDHLAYQSRQRHAEYSVRRAVYWSLMNTPIAGVTYGVHGIWSWEHTPRVPLNHENTGVARVWHDAMALPGSAQMGHMAELVGSLRWWTVRPAQELLASQPGGDDPARFVSAARAEDGSAALLYLPRGGSVRVRSDQLRQGLRAEWFDPRAGSRRPAAPDEGGVYQAPNDLDWVLVFSAP